MSRNADGSEVDPRGWSAAERWTNELEVYSDGQRQLEKARARLFHPNAAPARRAALRLQPLALWALGLTPLVAAAAFLLQSAEPAAAPSFTVQTGARERAVRAKPGQDLSAPPGQQRVLSFWEGSEVHLLTGAKAKVTQLAAHGAKLELLDGEAEVRITPSPDSTWAIDVDSFRVAVLGTHFFVSKLATGRGLSIRLVEGKVSVSSPCLTVPVRVSAGEQRLFRCELAAPAPTVAHELPVVAAPSGGPSSPVQERPSLAAPAPKPPSPLRQEVELMENIRTALTVDPARALVLVHEAGKRFPRGSLSEERQAFEVLALERLGHAAEASALAQSFLRRYPNGSFSARMRALVPKASP